MNERKLPFETPVKRVAVYDDGIMSEAYSRLMQSVATSIPGVGKETRSKLVSDNETLKVILFQNGKPYGMKVIMPDIKDVKVVPNNDTPKVVMVYFADGTVEKAVLDSSDTYSLEQGISICITKKVLGGGYAGSGSSIYNKIIARAMKVMNDNQRADEEAKAATAAEMAREKKIAEKNRQRKEAQIARKREEEIQIQTEAYYRAMKKIQEENKADVEKAFDELGEALMGILEEAEAESKADSIEENKTVSEMNAAE